MKLKHKNWLSSVGWFLLVLVLRFLEYLVKFLEPKKKNSLVSAGWFLMFIGGLYSWNIHKSFGGGNPKNTAEWIAESFVGFLLVSGTTLIAVGRYLRDERK